MNQPLSLQEKLNLLDARIVFLKNQVYSILEENVNLKAENHRLLERVHQLEEVMSSF